MYDKTKHNDFYLKNYREINCRVIKGPKMKLNTVS